MKNIDFAWREVTSVTMSGVWKNLCPQVVHDFCGFEKVDKESKEVFSNLVTLSKKLELDLQEDDFIKLLAVQHEELTNENLLELEAQRKDKERQEEEVTEELKRFVTQEMVRGFSLFKGTLLVFEAQDPNVERYRKVAAAVQNAIQCYHVIYDEKKRATIQISLDHFLKRVDRIESSEEPEPVPSMSGVSEIAACPPSPIAEILQLYHLPPPPPPPVSNSPCLFTRCQPRYASCCTVLFKVLYSKIKNVFFVFGVCFFMHYLCEKYYKRITIQYYMANCISWVPRLTLLDLQTNWTYECALGM